MRPALPRLDRFNVVLGYVACALLAAAVLVIYLQHNALTAQDRQTRIILRKISEETAAAVDSDLRRVFDGPVLDTVTAINHPDIKSGRLDLVAEQYAKAIRAFPQVERFFVWTRETQASAPDQVVFYDPAVQTDGAYDQMSAERRSRAARKRFRTDPDLGPLTYALALERSVTQQVYVTAERIVRHQHYDLFVRLYWTDADRRQVLAMMGFATNLNEVRRSLFPELTRRFFGRLLNPGGGSPRLELQILDAQGQRVFATGEPIPSLTVRRPLDMRFYPAADIRTRLADDIAPREWTMLVGPATTAALAPDVDLRGYSMAAVSVLLMLMGLFLSAKGFKRERLLARRQADFVSHVSHQLKTPLSLMNGVCETLTLDRARSVERQARYLDMMRYSLARLTSLVERILEFSRADEGRSYEMEPVQVGTLVRETVDAFRLALDDGSLEIDIVNADPSLAVLADPVALEQALINLLDNAVKYSDGVKRITVRVFRSVSDAVLEVTDCGIGIAEADLPRLFEKFYRGAGASLNREGFGLGLAIVAELVRAHHGNVEVDSRRGVGSTFRIRLPVLKGSRGAIGAVRGRFLSWLPRRVAEAFGREPESLEGSGR